MCHDGTVSQLRVSSTNVVEVFFSDRSLGLHFQIESISLNLINFYTPQSNLPVEYKITFWNNLFIDCKKLAKLLNVVGCDANSSVGHCTSTSIGGHQATGH